MPIKKTKSDDGRYSRISNHQQHQKRNKLRQDEPQFYFTYKAKVNTFNNTKRYNPKIQEHIIRQAENIQKINSNLAHMCTTNQQFMYMVMKNMNTHGPFAFNPEPTRSYGIRLCLHLWHQNLCRR